MKDAEKQQTPKNSLFMEVFDVMFIMLLCFFILLTTMLMRGKVLVGSGSTGGIDYSFNFHTFMIIIAALGAYMFYVISRSDNELRAMIKQRYDEVRQIVG